MIVVFGSINVDLVFRVTNLPRPGETVLAPSYAVVAGGKGANQAVAAARAGSETHMVGRVGRDGFAEAALAGLRAASVGLAGVVAGEGATGCAAICVDEAGHNQIVVASGANRAVAANLLDDALLGPDTTLMLQHEVDAAETWAAARRARDRGARVVLNAAPAAPLPAEAALDLLIVNEVEAGMIAAHDGLNARGPVAASRAIAAARGVATVVTLGGDGARAFAADAAWRVGALAIDPLDTTAAGDAFVGVLAATLDGGGDLATALHRASVAGGLACTVAGAQPSLPDAAAIDAALPRLAPPERV